ncbi:hypothetical protein V2H32_10110 [Streptococcus uberis]|uniref:hypothetical protein n=1 Tax=Streptococcus uberis TaxID=1349 RepID=UPI002E9CB3F3|nr:hypothetical protein [Streptococcus uberis]
MSNNIEIILDLDSLEIEEVIDLENTANEMIPEDEYHDSVDLNKHNLVISNENYKPASLIWQIELTGIIHSLYAQNKHGTYPYQIEKTGEWGKVLQLTKEEALWLTLEYCPELMEFVI